MLRALTKGPDGAAVNKFPAPCVEFPASGNAPHHSDLHARHAGPAPPGGCHDPWPRCALSQELEAKQTLLDQLRAPAAEHSDFFSDLLEAETRPTSSHSS